MAIPNTKATLLSYCKRQLGYPVVEINVDDDDERMSFLHLDPPVKRIPDILYIPCFGVICHFFTGLTKSFAWRYFLFLGLIGESQAKVTIIDLGCENPSKHSGRGNLYSCI